MPDPSILDARLAEIDRRLRMIQSGLEPVPEVSEQPGAGAASSPPRGDPLERSPPPPPPPPSSLLGGRSTPPPVVTFPAEPGSTVVSDLTARLSELTAAHERLLATTQNLLIEQADMLARTASTASVAAGPFADTQALQAFQRAISGLPQVREVAVREYVGNEGVILDVRLEDRIS